MRYAIVSDIHANRTAWETVLADIEGQRIDRLLCLGDMVGYGPSPARVVDSVLEHADNVLLGNHEAAMFSREERECFIENARAVIEWTRTQLTKERLEQIRRMPPILKIEEFVIAHGEVAEPGRFDYIMDIESARENFDACVESLIFVGHTHAPGVIARANDDGRIGLFKPGDFRPDESMRYIVNAGSVGYPRGGAERQSCYCIYDTTEGKVFFRQIPLDLRAYQREMALSDAAMRPYFLECAKRMSDAAGRSFKPALMVARSSAKPRITVTRKAEPGPAGTPAQQPPGKKTANRGLKTGGSLTFISFEDLDPGEDSE